MTHAMTQDNPSGGPKDNAWCGGPKDSAWWNRYKKFDVNEYSTSEGGDSSPGASPAPQFKVDKDAKYMLIRGVIYDVTEFVKEHPGGWHLISLGVGRDSTILFESYHLRDKLADAQLKRLPMLPGATPKDLVKAGVPFDAPPAEVSKPVEPSLDNFWAEISFPLPGDSEMFQAIKQRILKEVLAPRGRAYGRGGWSLYRDLMITFFTFVACSYYFIISPSFFSALLLGFAGAWVGLGIQHTANHGGATDSPFVGYILGLTDDFIGGSSLIWRYHHMVSHHAYCNDLSLDMDAYTSHPLLRMDERQEWHWYHQYQWAYIWILLPQLYFSIQWQEISWMLNGGEMEGIRYLGASNGEYAGFWILKAAHVAIYFLLPLMLHWDTIGLMTLVYSFTFPMSGAAILGALFIVSHNIEGTKPSADNKGIKEGDNDTAGVTKDWCKWQIETSASWGGAIASFFTGGLNLQIEHHLFPGVAHNLYPEIQPIIKEECAKRGVRYQGFDTLPEIILELVKYLRKMGIKPSSQANDHLKSL